MNRRLTIRLAAPAQGLALACLASSALFAQAGAAAAPRTPWGDPDLQGVRWTEDPQTWTRPWTFSPLTADENPVPSYECHEGNCGLANILGAARAEEKR